MSQIIPFPRRKRAPKVAPTPPYAALIPLAVLLAIGLGSLLAGLTRRRFR